MAEIKTGLLKAVTGNGTGSLKITPTANKRLHALQLQLTYSGGTNTLAGLMTALTEIRMITGTVNRWKLNGTQLRDFCLLNGTTFDFNGLPNTGAQVTIPLAPEWHLDNVAASLAWNPTKLNGPITCEIDSSANLTCVAYERTDDALNDPYSGILTQEVIKPVAGGIDFYTGEELQIKGLLYRAAVYPDSGNSNEPTPVGLYLGKDDFLAYENLTSAQNDEALERQGLTPSASGRSANIYDLVAVHQDALSRAWNLPSWGSAKIRIQAGGAMAGTSSILLTRIEQS